LIIRILAIMPSVSVCDQFFIDPSIVNEDITECSPIAVLLCPFNSRQSIKHLVRQRLFRLGTEVLSAFRCVDVFETNLVLSLVVVQ